jgi:hypothetical protein
MARIAPFAALAAASLFVSAAQAQTVDAVIPEIGQPGDVIRIAGSGLGGIDAVAFTATVGGFVGTWTLQVNPISTSPGQVVVEVPQFGNFAPPNAIPPGDALGTLRLVDGGAFSNPRPFGYLEATDGDVRTIGQGGSVPPPPTPLQSPRISFDLQGGIPEWGNPDFVLDLWQAPPASVAFAAIGTPGTLPFPQVFGGDVVLSLFDPIALLTAPAPTAPPYGTTSLKLPIKPQPSISAAGVKVALQWATVQLVTVQPAVSISNGLWVVL